MFCNHKWKTIETHRFNSLFEEGVQPERCSLSTTKELSKRGIISVVQCERCGKVEHIRTQL